MYYVPRGGNRGGADQFTWDSVKSDKDRECYLGHSLKAPVGRWQQGKDLQWFNKERKEDGNSAHMTEAEAVKQAEKEALVIALGQKLPSSLEPKSKPLRQKRSPSPHDASTSSPQRRSKKQKRSRTDEIDAVLLQKLKKRTGPADGLHEGKHKHSERVKSSRKQEMTESRKMKKKKSKKKKKKHSHHSDRDSEGDDDKNRNQRRERIERRHHRRDDRK